MNGDPAVEAASKAWRTASHGRHGDMPSSEKIAAMLTDAACEALKPIREKSEELDAMFGGAATDVAAGVRLALAQMRPLIYSAAARDEEEGL